MASTEIAIQVPPSEGLRKHILATFLRIAEGDVRVEEYRSYFKYYQKQCYKLTPILHMGTKPEARVWDSRSRDTLGLTHKHILAVVELIWKQQKRNALCYRLELQKSLASNEAFEHLSDGVDQAIDLALRVWLALNIRQEGEFSPGGAKSVHWGNNLSLQEIIHSQFPGPRIVIGVGGKGDLVLPRNLTITNLRRYSGIKVKWTNSLSEHLALDRDHHILKIFPLKGYLQALKKRLLV
jgi:hypothetical protein